MNLLTLGLGIAAALYGVYTAYARLKTPEKLLAIAVYSRRRATGSRKSFGESTIMIRRLVALALAIFFAPAPFAASAELTLRALSYFTDPEAIEVALDVLNHDTDPYLEYTLEETIRQLEIR